MEIKKKQRIILFIICLTVLSLFLIFNPPLWMSLAITIPYWIFILYDTFINKKIDISDYILALIFCVMSITFYNGSFYSMRMVSLLTISILLFPLFTDVKFKKS